MASRCDENNRERLDREERTLAERVLRGDRDAFDRLYDRYFARVAWRFRDLPEAEAQAAIWEALEQIFMGLETSEAPLAIRAFRIASVSRSPAARSGTPATGSLAHSADLKLRG